MGEAKRPEEGPSEIKHRQDKGSDSSAKGRPILDIIGIL